MRAVDRHFTFQGRNSTVSCLKTWPCQSTSTGPNSTTSSQNECVTPSMNAFSRCPSPRCSNPLKSYPSNSAQFHPPSKSNTSPTHIPNSTKNLTKMKNTRNQMDQTPQTTLVNNTTTIPCLRPHSFQAPIDGRHGNDQRVMSKHGLLPSFHRASMLVDDRGQCFPLSFMLHLE